MTEPAAPEQPGTSLPDQNQQKKPHGLMDTVRDNAPRIVGAFRLASDAAVLSSFNPYWVAFGLTAGSGRIMTMMYGTKENQRKMAQEKKEHPERFEEPTGGVISQAIHKVRHPREYPVEA